MPHYTGAGDDGATSLWGGGRIPKSHPRPEAFGAIDEATSALGFARALADGERTPAIALSMQQRLYLIMAELAVAEGKPVPAEFATGEDQVAELEAQAAELEQLVAPPGEFVIPGGSPGSAALHMARTIVRRAEREAVRLRESGADVNPQTLRYLNRASSVLFDLARYEEAEAGREAVPAPSPIRAARA